MKYKQIGEKIYLGRTIEAPKLHSVINVGLLVEHNPENDHMIFLIGGDPAQTIGLPRELISLKTLGGADYFFIGDCIHSEGTWIQELTRKPAPLHKRALNTITTAAKYLADLCPSTNQRQKQSRLEDNGSTYWTHKTTQPQTHTTPGDAIQDARDRRTGEDYGK